jgi:Zn-dependent M28 family amino/carboxypeptidase
MLALATSTALGAKLDAFLWDFTAAVTLVGAIPVVLSMIGNRSPGALDNASGVATVVQAAKQLGENDNVGVLLTDAEELGLAGARAWALNDSRNVATVLNCDGVDDGGGVQVMFSGRRPSRLLDVIARAATQSSVRYGVSRLIPGVLADSVAFSDARMDSVTFSRGTFRSLLRVHTRRDDLAHLAGTGIAETAALMATTARELARGDRR